MSLGPDRSAEDLLGGATASRLVPRRVDRSLVVEPVVKVARADMGSAKPGPIIDKDADAAAAAAAKAKKDEVDFDAMTQLLKLIGAVAIYAVGMAFLENIMAVILVAGVVYFGAGALGADKYISDFIAKAGETETGQKIATWVNENAPWLAQWLELDKMVEKKLRSVQSADELKGLLKDKLDPGVIDVLAKTVPDKEWIPILDAARKGSPKGAISKALFQDPAVIRAIVSDETKIALTTKQNLFEKSLIAMSVPPKLANVLSRDPKKLVNDVFSGDKLKALLEGKYTEAFTGTLPALLRYINSQPTGKAVMKDMLKDGTTTPGPFADAINQATTALMKDIPALRVLSSDVVGIVIDGKFSSALAEPMKREWATFVDVVAGVNKDAFAQISAGDQNVFKNPALITEIAKQGNGLTKELKTQLFLSAFETLKMPPRLADVFAKEPEQLIAAITPANLQQLLTTNTINSSTLMDIQKYLKATNQVTAFSDALSATQRATATVGPAAKEAKAVTDSFVNAIAGLNSKQIEELDPQLVKGCVEALMGSGKPMQANLMQIVSNPALLGLFKKLELKDLKTLLDKADPQLVGDMGGLLDWLKQPTTVVGMKNIDVLAEMFEKMGVSTMSQEAVDKFNTIIKGFGSGKGDPKALVKDLMAMLKDSETGSDVALNALAEAMPKIEFPKLTKDEAVNWIASGVDTKTGFTGLIPNWVPFATDAKEAAAKYLAEMTPDKLIKEYEAGIASMKAVLSKPVNLKALRDTLVGVDPANAVALTGMIESLMSGGQLDFAALSKIAGKDIMALKPLTTMDFSGLPQKSYQRTMAELTRDNMKHLLAFASAPGMTADERTSLFAALIPKEGKEIDIDSALDVLEGLALKYKDAWKKNIPKLKFADSETGFGYAVGPDGVVNKKIKRRIDIVEGELKRITERPEMAAALGGTVHSTVAAVVGQSEDNPFRELVKDVKPAAGITLALLNDAGSSGRPIEQVLAEMQKQMTIKGGRLLTKEEEQLALKALEAVQVAAETNKSIAGPTQRFV